MADAASRKPNRYVQIIEQIFQRRYRPGMRELIFDREEMVQVAADLGIRLPKNLGDLLYTFRYRSILPEAIRATAPPGEVWILRPAGRGRYCFVARREIALNPNPDLVVTRIPDSTPGIIVRYAMGDEQALLARLRYNRLIDIFTGVTCYSLQSHLRTSVTGLGQIETDEVYVGLDRRGAQYVLPIQAKGGSDRLSVVQIEQDIALCRDRFPLLICRPIAAQFMKMDAIALFEFEEQEGDIRIAAERHYRLVAPEEVTEEDLHAYNLRPAL